MQGLILAAGMGRRLKELTSDNTKCMVKVNGVTLIDRALHQLDALGLSKIVIVVGYEGQKLIDYIATLEIATPICYVNNPIYDKTNNIYSLALAKDYLLQEDTLLLESDIIFEDSVLRAIVDDPRETLALVDKYESWMDGTCIKIGEDDSIGAFIPGKNFNFNDIEHYYKTVNIYKFSKHFSETRYVPFLDAYSMALGNNEYYEQVLRVIAMLDDPEIKAKKLNGQRWYEIDDIQDLDIAESMFADDDLRLDKLQSRYGGYWRYPSMLDFCYLVNPYFPPRKLIDEMRASFERLLTQYPSGMCVNSLLAARNFDVHQEHIIVGNGAAELIKYLVERHEGKLGCIRPTFEEYPNRCRPDDVVCFWPQNENFAYDADDVTEFFKDKDISMLVLINPDNPSGNYIGKAELLRIADWCEAKGIRMIADESFADFADEEDNSLIDEAILNAHPHLVVVKSISKSYGVPGIRLGVLVSADEALIAGMKKDAAIWNINSFGEFYMQIAEKYVKNYAAALRKFKATRKTMGEALGGIPALRVIPSQANYFMLELTGNVSARELTRRLLTEHDILVKDLSAKLAQSGRQYVRVAVRTEEDNARLIAALKEILK